MGFYLLVAGAFAVLTVARLAQPGMFLDGLMYACISRNLAQGVGSFWFPSYTATSYPVFLEHPPLAFGLQAIPFVLLGDHLFVERGYAVVMGCVTALLTMAIWRSTVREKGYDWLPVVFWLLPATVTWAVVNNMLENTQAVFTTMAVLAVVRSLRPGPASYAWAAAGGAAVLGACLSKGPVGLFPLAAPVILALVVRDRAAQALRCGAVMLGAFAVGTGLVLWPDAPRRSLSTYWHQQVMSSLAGARERAASRWDLRRHLNGIVYRMGGLVALAWLLSLAGRLRPGASRPAPRPDRWTWFFLAVGVSGSLPIAISPKLMGAYLVPSIPMYSLGFACLALPVVRHWLEDANRRRVVGRAAGWVGVALLAASVGVPLARGPIEPRDRDLVAQVRALPVQPGTTISSCASAFVTDGAPEAYLQRFFRVSLDLSTEPRFPYYLQMRTDPRCVAPTVCRPLWSGSRVALLDCGQ